MLDSGFKLSGLYPDTEYPVQIISYNHKFRTEPIIIRTLPQGQGHCSTRDVPTISLNPATLMWKEIACNLDAFGILQEFKMDVWNTWYAQFEVVAHEGIDGQSCGRLFNRKCDNMERSIIRKTGLALGDNKYYVLIFYARAENPSDGRPENALFMRVKRNRTPYDDQGFFITDYQTNSSTTYQEVHITSTEWKKYIFVFKTEQPDQNPMNIDFVLYTGKENGYMWFDEFEIRETDEANLASVLAEEATPVPATENNPAIDVVVPETFLELINSLNEPEPDTDSAVEKPEPKIPEIEEVIPIYNFTNGLSAYYPFTGNANDATGNGLNGTPQNGVLFVYGINGQAASFNGASSFVGLASTTEVHPSVFTFSACIKLNQYSNDDNTGATIFANYNATRGAIFYISNTGKLAIRLHSYNDHGGKGIDLKGDTIIPLNTWTYVSASYDGNKLAVYVNGLEDGSDQFTNYTPSTVPPTIGKASWHSGSYFNGDIDEFRIYNRAFSADEVESFYLLESGQEIFAPAIVQTASTDTTITVPVVQNAIPQLITKTEIFYVGEGDGWMLSSSYPGSFETQRNDAVGRGGDCIGKTASVGLSAYHYYGGYLWIDRIYLPIDTSSIPDDADILSAKLSAIPSESVFKTNDNYTYIGVAPASQEYDDKLVATDFNNVGTQKFSSIFFSNFTVGERIEWEFNITGINNISKTGWTKLCLREGHDLENNVISIKNWNSRNWNNLNRLSVYTSEANIEDAPFLVVTYTVYE